jgi:hypothetical protein
MYMHILCAAHGNLCRRGVKIEIPARLSIGNTTGRQLRIARPTSAALSALAMLRNRLAPARQRSA